MTDNLTGDAAAEARIRRLSRRSFLQAAGVVLAGGVGLYEFNKHAPESDGIKTPIRKVLNFNDGVAANLFFSPNHRAREFPRAEAVDPKNNYKGATPTIDIPAWRLTLDRGGSAPEKLDIASIRALPAVQQTTELKCIEGWSVVVSWTGARFVDFAKQFPPPADARYVSLVSEPADFPDERYYVGIDLASALHPQTLLAYEMNDKPLGVEHGAPLRLVIPTKYGIKNIKLITGIAYSAARPADYWFEQGYDYYAGL
jgi:DMSO/TMAO reductase YedYZ molybdopterin-dependent catalytic subunit